MTASHSAADGGGHCGSPDGSHEAVRVVSVVVVNWNTCELLRACLASLPHDSERLAIEAIVVDNGSDDGSADMVADEYPSVRLIRNAQNLGFVQANNQGLRAATGGFLFMLNSDAEVRAGCVDRLVDVAAGDGSIGAVGPRLLNSDGTRQDSFGPFPRLVHRLFPSRFEAAYVARTERKAAASTARTAPVDWLAGAALLFRRDVLQAVGPLDERYRAWYDDLDWCQKLRQAGYQRVFVPGAVVVHHGRQSGAKLANRELAQQVFDSEYTYLRLHAGRAATCTVFALRMGKALLRRLLPVPGAGRDDAAFRLAYHRSRMGRFCTGKPPE